MDNPKIKLEVSDDHMGNFIEAVRTRKNPISPVEEGHRSAVIGHLIVIALRTGKSLRWNPAKEKFEGSGEKEANAHLARPQRKPYTYDFT
jgi:myo-inositol 2-dehydrogenase/D-chiro-inositol 1-dehydrogenase